MVKASKVTDDTSLDQVINLIHRIWFPQDYNSVEQMKALEDKWFRSTPEFDLELEEQFGELLAGLESENGEQIIDDFSESVRGRVALIILTDQFPRNIFRGSARAFAFDELALAQTLALIKSKQDLKLNFIHRRFAYLPLEHSEDTDIQELCIKMFKRLLTEAPEAMRKLAEDSLDYAQQHYDIIAQFGRYPHRNEVLKRESTIQEIAYLESGAKRFGQ